ncbi:SIR2 family protein [Arthrobacter sp. NPDC058288]|uniref:SIR2 family protein n=1 Tax=Arthrobacter sp. NPDC058288 TaxID=3346424 RepID=UPI0036E0E973
MKDELLRALTSDSLIVLTGLGTSLGIPPVAESKAPNMWDLWEKVSVLDGFAFASGDVPAEILEAQNIEHFLSHIQAKLSINDDCELSDFLAKAQDVILDACSFVGPQSELDIHQLFLRKIGRRSARLQRTKLFTTNYDLAFEEAAARARFHIIDGFGLASHRDFEGALFDLDFVRRGTNDRLILEGNVLHLLKLHGSVDWERSGASTRRVSGKPKDPVLIYPSANKYQLSFRQPYLEMMSRFQMALRLPDVSLLVVGFGFNDEHIVAPIEAAIRGNVGLRLIVVDPGIRAESKRSKSLTWLERLAQDGDHRISLLEGRFDDLVRMMPDASEFDERQAHADRISRLDDRGTG